MKKAITSTKRKQQGYILLSIMLLMTLMLIALSIEIPRIRQQVKREKEEELVHRAFEYTGAVRRFYRKFGRYPVSMDELEKANNLRFLRKRYKDPMTGKDDWRLIRQNEALLKVGSTPSLNRNGQVVVGSTDGSPDASSPFSSISPNNSGPQNSGPQNPGPQNSGPQSSGPQNVGSGSSGSAFNNQLGGGGIAGVASKSKEESIKMLGDKNHYNDWQFVYDPKFEVAQGPPGPGPGPGPSPTPSPSPKPPGQ